MAVVQNKLTVLGTALEAAEEELEEAQAVLQSFGEGWNDCLFVFCFSLILVVVVSGFLGIGVLLI